MLKLSLRHLPQGRRSLEAQQDWARELKEALTDMVWPDWEGPEKQQALAWTERVLAGQAQLGPETVPPLSPGELRTLEQVLAFDGEGRFELAAQQLAPLVERHPRSERVQVLACYLGLRVAPKLPSTREQCEAAATRFPDQPSPLLNLAALQLQAGNPEQAQASLLKVRQRLESLTEVEPEHWAALASGFQQASCVTWAEQAAAKGAGADGATKVLDWAKGSRRWMALPVEKERSGVEPEREGQLVREVRAVEAHFEKGALKKAQTQLAALAKEFPRAAVVKVLQCEQHLRAGKQGPARAACREAIAAHEEAVQAHFLLGWMAVQSRAGEEARKHLERVTVLEPRNSEAWRMLAEQYRAAGKTQALEALKARHLKELGKELR
jgi:predicted Zn-dependent protease